MFQNGYIESFTPENGNGSFNMEFFGDIFSNLVFSLNNARFLVFSAFNVFSLSLFFNEIFNV